MPRYINYTPEANLAFLVAAVSELETQDVPWDSVRAAIEKETGFKPASRPLGELLFLTIFLWQLFITFSVSI